MTSSNNHGKPQKNLKAFLTRYGVFILLGILFACGMVAIRPPNNLPQPPLGTSLVVYEDLSARKRAELNEVDATNEIVYLNYSGGLICACDRSGDYLFSIIVPTKRNGGASIYCSERYLRLMDYESNIFIYDGDKLVLFIDNKDVHSGFAAYDDHFQRYGFKPVSQLTPEESQRRVFLKWNKVVDASGKTILRVPYSSHIHLALHLGLMLAVAVIVSHHSFPFRIKQKKQPAHNDSASSQR